MPQTLFLGRRVTCPALLTTLSDWCRVWFLIVVPHISVCVEQAVPKICFAALPGPSVWLRKLEMWGPGISFSASLGSCLWVPVSASAWPTCHLQKLWPTWAMMVACLPVYGQPAVSTISRWGIAGSVSGSVWQVCCLHNDIPDWALLWCVFQCMAHLSSPQ